MPTFKDNLELIKHHAPEGLTFEATDYIELIAELEEQVGKMLVGSERAALGPLLLLYANTKAGQVAALYSQPRDFVDACSFLRLKHPMPKANGGRRFVPTQYDRIVPELNKALDTALRKRDIKIPTKLKADIPERDESGRVDRSSIVTTADKLIKGLLECDAVSVAIIAKLLVAKESHTIEPRAGVVMV